MAQLHWLSGRKLTDSAGAPYALAKAFFFQTGTTTPQNTYTSASLGTPNTNPVIADANGVFPDIYFAAQRYKQTIKTSADVSLPEYDFDPIDATGQIIVAAAAPSPTYPLLRYANSSDGHTYRRNLADSAWIDEGLSDSLLNAASVTEQLAGTDATKSSTPDSVAALWQRGTSITPSAGTVSLPSTGGGVYTINAGNFSAISSAAGGRVVIFEFAGASTITHNATSMDLPGNANITTAAGWRAALVNTAAQDATGSNWRMLWYQPDDGSFAGVFATQAQQEAGTQTTFPINSAVQHFHRSAAKAWINFNGSGTPAARDSYNISSITDNSVGNYTLHFSNSFSGATYAFALSCGSGTSVNTQIAQQGSAAPTASAFRMITYDLTAAGVVDATWIGAVFYGDL